MNPYMIEIIKVLVLSIVEGMTEFLPVSSTGHLIIANEFIRLEPEAFSNAFNIIIQLGAILAVIKRYFYKLNPLDLGKISYHRELGDYQDLSLVSKAKFRIKNYHRPTIRLWIKVVIGFLPAMVLGLALDDLIDQYLFSTRVVAVMLVAWGLIIILVEKMDLFKLRVHRLGDIKISQALKTGFFQCLAMVPGTSRSAATIIGGMFSGMDRKVAAEYSFFLAIPTMLGATSLKILKLGGSFSGQEWGLILLGSVLSYLVADLVIKVFMDYIKKHSFTIFGIYRIILGILVFVLVK